MNQPKTETRSAFVLSWSFEATQIAHASGNPLHAMKLSLRLDAREELYVADRLWDFNDAGARIAEPFGVYRIVHDRTLVLLFGQAPMPHNVQPRVTFRPLYSRVRAGESLRREVLLAYPIDEYTALDRDVRSPNTLVQLDQVTLALEYRTRASMREDPQPPPREDSEAVGYVVYDPERILSTCSVAPFAVHRRTR
jgi:hypothetical protein